jgi:dolichol-phosphate mannosyltransferase
MESLAARSPRVQWVSNEDPGGFGYAVRRGLEQSTGAGVCIYMAYASDSPDDVVAYYDKLKEGYDCVFGSRFMSGGRVTGYPIHKLVINRLVNWFVRILFALRTNDTTNAFKAYRREVIQGVQPLLSRHFNLTVELPLKAVIRGYSYAVVPISWRGRVKGFSKLKIKEMGSRYLFIVAYVFLERFLSRGDYKRTLPALQPITETRPPRN